MSTPDPEGRHPCPVRKCPTSVADRLLMCYPHWAAVPKRLQVAVYRAYNRGAGVGSPALREAQLAAVAAVNEAEAGATV